MLFEKVGDQFRKAQNTGENAGEQSVLAAGGLAAGALGRESGGGVGTGLVTTVGVLGVDAGGGVTGRAAAVRGACPLKRIVWPG